MPGRKGEAPLLLRLLRVVHLHDPGSGLLLEPLPRVARIDAGAVGGLAGRARPVRGQHAVEAQAVPQVDGEHVHRAQGRGGETLHERVANMIRAGHRIPFPAADAAIMARSPSSSGDRAGLNAATTVDVQVTATPWEQGGADGDVPEATRAHR